jgi:hypothetical protein
MGAAVKRFAASGVLVAMLAIGLPALATGRPAAVGDHSDNTMARCPVGTQDCPTADPFYRPPARLGAVRNGGVIRTRPTTITEPGVSPKAAYQISYRSEDAFNHPVMDVATVLIPTQEYAGGGPRPLVSLQFAIDSLGAQCAPSYDLTHPGANTGIDVVAQAWLSELLAQGYVVVASDHEGPAEQFVVGQQEGHAVLDAIRAAEALPAAGLSRRSPVVLTGYSGGAHATGWASELAASYAPELRIVGAAEGGTPASIPAVADYLNGSSNFGYAIFAIEAYRRAFPAENIPKYFNAAGKSLLAEVRTMCVSTLDSHGGSSSSGPNPDFKTFDDYTTVRDVQHLPQFQELMRYESLGQRAPQFPVYNYQAYNDEIIPFAQSVQLASYYCSHGVPVEFALLQGEHEVGLAEGAPQLFEFIRERFAGSTPVNDCSTVVPLAAQLPQPPQTTLPRP